MEKGEYEKLDEKVLQRIQASGFFPSRLLISTDPDSASKLYGSVEHIPQTATRAMVLRDSNVKIEGEMLYQIVKTAPFSYTRLRTICLGF